MSQSKHKTTHFKYSTILQLGLLVVAGIILIPQAGQLSGFSAYMRGVDIALLGAATLFSVLTFIFAALTYIFLSPRPLPIPRTIVIQVACSFANRLLPAGVGGMGVNGRYLERSARLAAPHAASIVSANQLLGFLGYALILALLLVTFDISRHITTFTIRPLYAAIGIGLLTGLVIVAFLLSKVSRKIFRFLTQSVRMLYQLAQKPRSLLFGFFSSVAITFCFAGAFYLSCLAADVHIPFGLVTLIYLGGAAVASATPTPGGLGGVEAAMVAGLIGVDVPGGQALAAVIGFRLVTFWLPILPGYIALQYANHKKWI